MQNINFIEGAITACSSALGYTCQPNYAKIVFPQGWYLTIFDSGNILKFMDENPEHYIAQNPRTFLEGRTKEWKSKNPYSVFITACNHGAAQSLSRMWNTSRQGLKKHQKFLPFYKHSDDLNYAQLSKPFLEAMIDWLAKCQSDNRNDEGIEITRNFCPDSNYLPENWIGAEFQPYQPDVKVPHSGW